VPHLASRTIVAALIAFAGALAVSRGEAADGRIEVNQACAETTGCGPNDSPGFPVTLSSGAYELTSDLVVSDPNTSGIAIPSDHTWVDLRGFSIKGPTSCVYPGPVCTPPSGNGAGIIQFAGEYATVVNGTVRGFAAYGIFLRNRSRLDDVLVTENAADGVVCLNGCVIRRVRAIRNAGQGIDMGLQGVLLDSIADGNGSDGVESNEGAVIVGNTADNNGKGGIAALMGGQVVSDNQARRNRENGIRASVGGAVEGNTVTENVLLGLFLNNAAAFGFNVIRTDPAVPTSGTVNAGPQNLGGNLCNGLLCP
jgi:hypothetical protein